MIMNKNSARKQKAKKAASASELDSTYLVKILLFFILGTFWIRLQDFSIGGFSHVSLPVGFLIGLLVARHEHFQIDRKMEYLILIVATFVSYFLPMGLVI
jgi:multisubunit Na+/H+ antiporter MnhE subunit